MSEARACPFCRGKGYLNGVETISISFRDSEESDLGFELEE